MGLIENHSHDNMGLQIFEKIRKELSDLDLDIKGEDPLYCIEIYDDVYPSQSKISQVEDWITKNNWLIVKMDNHKIPQKQNWASVGLRRPYSQEEKVQMINQLKSFPKNYFDNR